MQDNSESTTSLSEQPKHDGGGDLTELLVETEPGERVLRLNYSGRIIDHLGLQMYQSPVAAVAELVANAWDADTNMVEIELPEAISDVAELVVRDDGHGMSFVECQDRFLNVGYARRGDRSVETSRTKKRRILGRKGIGKFAGFGIAEIVRVDTISSDGERTVFEMNISKLRSDDYVNPEGKEIDLILYEGADAVRKQKHGTTVRLRQLVLSRSLSAEAFARSMARRFLLHQTAANFRIRVNGTPLPEGDELLPVEFSFPGEYRDEERPGDLRVEGQWGIEAVSGQEIRWRVRFYREPIGEEELRGISVFAGGKMVQAPFFFNLSGGLPGQHGQQYISGQIQADYLDEQEADLIAPERQRVNWDYELAAEIQAWGRGRVKQLLGLWRSRRGEERERHLQAQLAGFAARLGRLGRREQRTVSRAIRQVARIDTLSQSQFEDLGGAILTAWEQGRLHDLIGDMADVEELTADQLVGVLAEAQVLSALSTAEAIKTKLLTVGGLKQRIDQQELENAVRDYISEHPWLVSPKWETYAVETGVKTLLDRGLSESGIDTDSEFCGRVDLALSSGDHLLILEFMRPGLRLDWDHVNRFERYVRIVRSNLEVNTGGLFRRATGYIVADKLNSRADIADKIRSMEAEEMFALDWPTLFANAIGQWRDFLVILAGRNSQDERLQALADL